MMLQQDTPEDFVIATGVQHSVREFIEWSGQKLGLTIEFSGSGLEEVGRVTCIEGDLASSLSVGDTIVRIDPRYFRPARLRRYLEIPLRQKKSLDGYLRLAPKKCVRRWLRKTTSRPAA